jgi:hypothetical protein
MAINHLHPSSYVCHRHVWHSYHLLNVPPTESVHRVILTAYRIYKKKNLDVSHIVYNTRKHVKSTPQHIA